MTKFKYKLFGLVLESELQLPELIDHPFGKIDVIISFGAVPKHLPVVAKRGVLFESGPDNYLFRKKDIGGFHVQNGNQITIQTAESVDENDLRLFLFGPVMGALLQQKNYIPLHGSAIVIGKMATIIIGNSAAGKSTIAASLKKKGYTVIADDISAIKKTDSGDFIIFPGIPYIKIWKNVLKELSISRSLDKVRPQLEKYKLPIDQSFEHESFIVNKIIAISTKNTEGISINKVLGFKKLELLKQQTYRYQYIEGMGYLPNHFMNITELAEKVNILAIKRPTSPLKIDELSQFIEQEILQGN